MLSRTTCFIKKIRVFLVFFSLLVVVSCKQSIQNPRYRIDYDNEQKAYQIAFDGVGNFDQYSIRIKGSTTSVLGKYSEENGSYIFRPVIPFSWEQDYEIYKEEELYIEFAVRVPEKIIRPKLLAIYPRLDTLPENLLKMYFEFDKPMRQLQSSLNFIKVFDQTTGQQVDIFLQLENELWNQEKTRLTLWLDPGRIKKDLIPNQKKGIPIVSGHQYELIVERNFSGGEHGADLGKLHVKRFYVAERDKISPNVDDWQITIPKPNTKEAVGIEFDEFLDLMLVNEFITIVDANEEEVSGELLTSIKGDNTLFIPSNAWKKGNYTIMIDSKLEDLAGNNLNRLFDVDLQKDTVENTEFKVIKFSI